MGMKKMAEEENDRLWAELEEKGKSITTITNQYEKALKEKEETIKELRTRLQNGDSSDVSSDANNMNAILSDHIKLQKELSSKNDEIKNLEEDREKCNEEIKQKNTEINELTTELKERTKTWTEQINKELWDKNKMVDKLQDQLSKICNDKGGAFEELGNELKENNKEL